MRVARRATHCIIQGDKRSLRQTQHGVERKQAHAAAIAAIK